MQRNIARLGYAQIETVYIVDIYFQSRVATTPEVYMFTYAETREYKTDHRT